MFSFIIEIPWIQRMRKFVDVEVTIWSCARKDSALSIELHSYTLS
jgi:hypothetical protein